MSDFKSKSDYLKWLAFGHSNGLLDTSGKNTPVSKKGKYKVKDDLDLSSILNDSDIIKNITSQQGNLDVLNSKIMMDNGGNIKSSLGVVDGEIPVEALDANSLTSKSTAAAGELSSGAASATAPIPYAQIGNILGEVVEGNNNLLENRSADKNRSVAGGALKGAGSGAATGAMLGSVVPGVGTAIGAVSGAVIGGIAGGIKGKNAYEQGADDLNQYLGDRNKGMTRDQVTMFAAYGAELPEMALGGDPVEFNGNSHEEGGIALGKNVEVEDGEVKVGNYVFSDRLVNEETGKTFAAEAKKITDKYKEYENDGPSMRAQNKMLEAIKVKNDVARQAQEAKDAIMMEQLQGDHAAYGAMISKGDDGSYIVDKSHKALLNEAAKLKGMDYKSYVENVFACGGHIKKMAYGGDKDKDFLPGNPNELTPPNYSDLGYNLPLRSSKDLFQGEYGDLSSAVNRNIDFPQDRYTTSPDLEPGTLPSMPTRSANMFQDNISRDIIPTGSKTTKTPSDNYTTYPGLEDDNTKVRDISKLDNAALLATSLPDLQNLIRSQSKANTKFDRLQLNDIDLEQERASLKEAIARARAVQDKNVRGTATSSGDALAALSAGNAGLSSQESEGLARINANERNANTQMQNRQAEVNLGISNEEFVARQQDEAMRASVSNAAISNMGQNTNTYLRDKKLDVKNEDYNKMITSLLDSGEYTMVPDGKGGFQILHKASMNTNKTK